MTTVRIGLAVSLAAALTVPAPVRAQGPGRDSRSFDVVSIRPAAPVDWSAPAPSGSQRPSSMLVTSSRVSIRDLSLTDVLMKAFGVETYQLVAPDWARGTSFDIQATLPPDAEPARVPEMLRTMLADRFGMTMHRELRTMDAYVMTVAKRGHALTEAPPPSTGTATMGNAGAPVDSPSASGPVELRMSTDTYGMLFSAGQNGNVRVRLIGITMNELAGSVSSLVGHPVVDRTGLAGTYLVQFEAGGADLAFMPRGSSGVPAGAAPGTAAMPANAASVPLGPSAMIRSLEQLGLTLEPRRVPIDVIVVDRLERPTPN